MIELKKVDAASFRECIALTVQEAQEKYVRSNLYSLAEAYICLIDELCMPLPLAIYDNGSMIGFALVYYHEITSQEIISHEKQKQGFYEVRRFMVGQQYQGKGYGKKAFGELITYLEAQPLGEAGKIVLDYMPENYGASHIYHSFGFCDTEEYNQYGEVRSVLKLSVKD